MAEQIKWGILGNANIARVCVIPAIQKSRNGTVHALATRSPENAKETAVKNNITGFRLFFCMGATLDRLAPKEVGFVSF